MPPKYVDRNFDFCNVCREVDEALRPGVYALVDSCSDQDRQCLHTVFGGKYPLLFLKIIVA